MSLFKVLLHYANGESEEDDEVFTTEQEAEDHGSYLLACCSEGAETLHLSNPGDYPNEDSDDVDFEVIEIPD